MRRGKQKVRMSTSVTEIDADNSVKVRKTKRKSAGRRPAEKDPLALPKRKPKAVPTKAARKQPAQPEEYEVEKIVGHREKGGTTVFRIRWKGWAAKDDTWQEEDDLNCGAILKKYKATMKATASPKKSTGSPKKRGRPSLAAMAAAAKKSPKKGVASGKVTKKKLGRPSTTKSPKKTKKAAVGGKKRGRKPKDEQEWEVEEVTAVRTTEAGTEEFYIKWKGYSSEENTWEPADNVANCDKAINRFRESQGEDAVPATTTNGDAEEDGGGDEDKEAAAEEEEDEKDVSGVAEDADDASMDE